MTLTTQNWAIARQEALRKEASNYIFANYEECDLGYSDPAEADWKYEARYDILKLLHNRPRLGWAEWLRQEVEMSEAGAYDSMFNSPIKDAIVVFERNGQGYIWDGWHRTAASIMRNQRHIPAIVGKLRLPG